MEIKDNKVKLKLFTTKQLLKSINDKKYQLIDIRPIDTYNGWKLKNEKRGGHIKGAISLPFKWLDYIDWIEIVQSKKINPNNHPIIYGYDKLKIDKVARQFIKLGYKDVGVYYHFYDEWCKDEKLPMQKLKRYSHLVSANWLNDLITKGWAPEFKNKSYVICHSHYQNRASYEKGHIPKAIDLDTNLLESPETWNRRSPNEIKKVLEQHGITHDTTVVLYGRFSYPKNNDPFPGSSAGQLGAFRCAFILLYAGVQDVRILNGGLQSWIDAGYNTTKKEFEKKPVKNFGITIPSNPDIVVDIDKAKEILKSPGKNLISVRSWKEFIGEDSGYNYIEKKGRIPGAVFGNCGSDAYHMENYRNLDHTTREYHEIEKMWSDVGITPDKHNSFYCGTGWRGSEAFFNAWLMGWKNISLFDGGWFEWTNNGNPFETGEPEKSKLIKIME